MTKNENLTNNLRTWYNKKERSLVESYFLKLNSHLKAIFQALLTELRDTKSSIQHSKPYIRTGKHFLIRISTKIDS